MTDNMLKFNKNRKFVIMQVADPQDLHFVRHTMIKMLNKAYSDHSPLIKALFIPEDVEMVAFGSNDKAMVFNTAMVPLQRLFYLLFHVLPQTVA